jgi:hypothetical protein
MRYIFNARNSHPQHLAGFAGALGTLLNVQLLGVAEKLNIQQRPR